MLSKTDGKFGDKRYTSDCKEKIHRLNPPSVMNSRGPSKLRDVRTAVKGWCVTDVKRIHKMYNGNVSGTETGGYRRERVRNGNLFAAQLSATAGDTIFFLFYQHRYYLCYANVVKNSCKKKKAVYRSYGPVRVVVAPERSHGLTTRNDADEETLITNVNRPNKL